MIDTGLKGKVVLVTGANNPLGIGAATAKAFSREGSSVFLTYLRTRERQHLGLSEQGQISEEDIVGAIEPGQALYTAMNTKTADEVLDAIHKEGGTATAIEADLADPTTASPSPSRRIASRMTSDFVRPVRRARTAARGRT